MRAVAADPDAVFEARVVRRVSLRYRGGADDALDRPAHVRAASGLCWWRGHLAVVCDDVSFVGLIDPDSGLVEAFTVPHAPGGRRQFDTGRGNKADKLDLECVFAADHVLIALGSDSGLEVRRQAMVLNDDAGLIPLPRLYAALRRPELGRGHLNLEAAVRVGDRVFLGNRGGDVGDDGAPTIDAITELPLAALLELLDDPAGAPVPDVRWRPLSLGTLGGAALRLTELTADADGHLWYAATAEATTSAYDDGHVLGSVIGRVGGGRSTPIDAKLEGLAFAPAAGPDRLYATVDADDPARPSELLDLAIVPGSR